MCPVQGQPFPHTWSQKDVVRGCFLERLLETPPAVRPVSLATFLMQKENEAGPAPCTRKPKTKRAERPSAPRGRLCRTACSTVAKAKQNALLPPCLLRISADRVVQSGSQNQAPSFPTSSLDAGGSNPSEVAHPPARPSLNQHILNSGFPSPSQGLLPKTPSHSHKEQRRRPLGFTLKSWPCLSVMTQFFNHGFRA